MANRNTIWDSLTSVFDKGVSVPKDTTPSSNVYNLDGGVYQAKDREDYDVTKRELQQQKYLQSTWAKVDGELYQKTIHYETSRIGSYSDFENMEFFPEIGAALDIFMEESVTTNGNGDILNIYSNSDRVKKILTDLFVNRLNIHTNLPMWTRNVAKYGDNFIYLNLQADSGVVGARQLPNYEIERHEGDAYNIVSRYNGLSEEDAENAGKIRYVWKGRDTEFTAWQITHFRLLGDDRKLPYGTSLLEKARRIYKQLLVSEDAMLVYRVTRAPERRVYKINVGNIDPKDVNAFVNNIANKFKRKPLIDPQTGQIDVKYNQLSQDQDIFIPVRSENASTPIDTLAGACISLDTKIPLLDGRTLELNDIIKEWDEGNRDLWVYSCDPETGNLAPGMITWAGTTRKDTEVIKVILDNGEEVITTPDHKWVHRTKGFVEAKDLNIGDSLMPYYTREKKIRNSKSTYKQTWDNAKQKWVYDHRMVANYMKDNNQLNEMVYDEDYVDSDKNTIHHLDINRYNNNPSNLVFMNNEDHYKYHSDTFGKNFSKMGYEAFSKKMKEDSSFRNVIIEKRRQTTKRVWVERSEAEKKSISEKQSKGLKKYINNLSDEELKYRMSHLQTKASKRKRLDTYLNNPNKPNFDKVRVENSRKYWSKETSKIKQSELAKKLWSDSQYRDKVFSKKQTLTFTDTLYNMFFEMFKLNGRADLTLKELNESPDFMSEFINSNLDIRSSMTNLNEFTRTHLDKMLKERGFSNYREWCKIMANKLGYKNVRAWRYYINKEKESLYNHKIKDIIWLSETMDTGTITVDGDEKYHNYHTFAIDSGVFIKNSNLDAISDIEYLQNKLFAALRVPKPFLGFEDTAGEGKNLALQDIRFARTINRLQQAMIQGLNSIAIIHLYMLGFEDELDNFTITLNNPSTQAEMLRIEQLQNKISAYRDAVSDAGNGFAAMSMSRARKEILGMSEDEIKHDLLEQRFEKAASAELEKTSEIIKKTGAFDVVDNLYGDPDAEYSDESAEGGGGDAAGGGGGGGDFGSGGDLGDFGAEEIGDEGFGDEEGGEDFGGEDFGAEDFAVEDVTDEEGDFDIPEPEATEESKKAKDENLITENVTTNTPTKPSIKHMDALLGTIKHPKPKEPIKMWDNKRVRINENIESMIKGLDDKLNK